VRRRDLVAAEDFSWGSIDRRDLGTTTVGSDEETDLGGQRMIERRRGVTIGRVRARRRERAEETRPVASARRDARARESMSLDADARETRRRARVERARAAFASSRLATVENASSSSIARATDGREIGRARTASSTSRTLGTTARRRRVFFSSRAILAARRWRRNAGIARGAVASARGERHSDEDRKRNAREDGKIDRARSVLRVRDEFRGPD
jgi:hypothetical protein